LRVIAKNRLVLFVLITTILGLAASARAQSDNPANAGVQFDFSLPGARSLALGGAFVAVADDATAAWSNPAGLLALTRQEVSFEGRAWEFSSASVVAGHAFGSPTGVGFDTVSGLQEETFSSWTGAPSFISYVYPKSRYAFAFYRHELQKFSADLESDGVFIRTTSQTPVFPGGAVDRAQPYNTQLDISVVDYGGSAAFRLGGGLSAGISLVVSDFSLEAQTDLFTYVPFNNFNAAVPPTSFTGVGQYYGPPNFASSNVFTRTTEEGDDISVAVSTGLLWRASDGKVSAGFAYRQGPSFTYSSESLFGPGIVAAGGFAKEGDVADTEEIDYAVPNVFSVGAAFRPNDNLLLSAEYDFVQYSRLSENTAEIFGVEESPFPGESQKGELIRNSLYIEDANQIRGGAEYAFVTSFGTLAARFGVWYDPDHRMQFDRDNMTPQERASIARTDVRYLPGDDAVHMTPGFGIAYPRFQIDTAFDASEPTKTFSISTVVRF
jgi:long-subunit fatty acid transport protein